MSLVKSVHKRKVRKFYGYIFLSSGLFFLVLFVCMSIFWLRTHSLSVVSPLGTLKAFALSHDSNAVLSQVGDACGKYSVSCQNIEFTSQQDITFTINNKQIYISTTKNIPQEIASLQLIIRQLTMEGKEFHRLDFRYDRPVISY